MRRGLAVVIAILLVGGVTTAVILSDARRAVITPMVAAATARPARRPPAIGSIPTPTTGPTAAPTTGSIPAPTTAAPTTAAPTTGPVGRVALAGCPPPVHPPGPPGPPPWHPTVLVPDSALPPEEPPIPWASDLHAIDGKGMWVWQYADTEGGNAGAIVRRATQAGLRQLWVRVGDSLDGFYGATELDSLVGPAHRAGLSVIGWGFPYLYDPVGDARWSAQALSWRGPGGDRLDGFSADIEKATEGVDLSERRAAVYLGALRRAAGNRLLVATVYPPTDANWSGGYPYAAIARYVDAFASMIYWECVDPGTAALPSLERLGTLRPVHLIGQAYNMADDGGRAVSPSPEEIRRFLDVARRNGAVGASFWVWQSMTSDEWDAMSAFPWS